MVELRIRFDRNRRNIPDDVMRVDQTTQEMGLAQENLPGKEIAVKVVRQFYEALIAKDYAKVGFSYDKVSVICHIISKSLITIEENDISCLFLGW